MSYSYGQFTSGESYSTPPTPIDGFPQWETVEREQEQQQQLQHQQPPQQQQQLQQAQEEQQHSPTQPTSTFQLIQLEDAHSQSMESNQPPGSLESGTIDDTPIHLHHVHHDLRSAEGRLETPRDDFIGMIGFIDHQASSSSASGAAKPPGAPASASTASGPSSSAMVVRSARSTRQYVQSLQPYGRSQSAASGRGPSTVPAAAGPSRSGPMSMREAQVSGPGPLRFVHHNLAPGVAQVPVTSAIPSALPSAMPSPASTSGRVMGLGSVARYVFGCCAVCYRALIISCPYLVHRSHNYSSRLCYMLRPAYPTIRHPSCNNRRERPTLLGQIPTTILRLGFCLPHSSSLVWRRRT